MITMHRPPQPVNRAFRATAFHRGGRRTESGEAPGGRVARVPDIAVREGVPVRAAGFAGYIVSM